MRSISIGDTSSHLYVHLLLLVFRLQQQHRGMKTLSCSRGTRPTHKLVTQPTFILHVSLILRSVSTLNTLTCLSAECGVYESPSLPEETIHYASLGRQNWRERPNRTPPDQNHHSVIYSSVITRPAAR